MPIPIPNPKHANTTNVNVPKHKSKPVHNKPVNESNDAYDDDKPLWRVMHSMFRDDHLHIVRPHIDSYNDVFQRRLPDLLRDCNPVVICPSDAHCCNLFIGGKTGNRVYYGKPVVYEGDTHGGTHILVPTEARMRNLTYSLTLHADIEVEFIDILSAAEMPTTMGVIDADRAALLARGGGPNEPAASVSGDEEYHSSSDTDGDADSGGGGRKKRLGQEDPAAWHVGTMEEALRHTVVESFDLNTRKQTRTYTIKNVYLGKIPIMLQSDYCLLRDVPPAMRVHLGECSDDPGGYFIIDGKERMFPLREIPATNHVIVTTTGPDKTVVASIESLPNDTHSSRMPVQQSVRFVPPDTEYSNGQLVFDVPSWLICPIPLFVLFRALGILSDKEIIDFCVLDQDRFAHMVDLFLPSIHDAGEFCTQFSAFRYISTCLIDPSTTSSVLHFLTEGLLPHVGSNNFRDKALHIGHMAMRVLLTHMDVSPMDDISSLVHKRIQTPGEWLFTCIRTAYVAQVTHIHDQFTRIMKQYRASYETNLWALVVHNHADVFRKRVMESSIHTAFINDTAVVDRRSFWSMLRQFRAVTTTTTTPAAGKLDEEEGKDDEEEPTTTTTTTIHGSHWGYYCPLDHPSLTMACVVSCVAVPVCDMVQWLRRIMNMKLISELSLLQLSSLTKMVVNGVWVGSITDAPAMVAKMRLFRRNAMLPMHTSISFYVILNEVHILTDRGRPTRPLFYADDITGEWSFKRETLRKELTSDTEGAFTWRQITQGFHEYRSGYEAGPNPSSVYADLSELYAVTAASATQPTMMQRYLVDRKAIVDFVDANETATSLIALGQHHDILEKRFTHKEIHDSLTLGLMANTAIIHVEHNPATSTTRAIEYQATAISHYHSTPEIRLEPDGVTHRVLHAGQLPAVHCRMSSWVSRDQHPWGINAIVAVMAWNGANASSAVVINEAAIQRGLFHFTEYTTLDITADSLAGEHIDPSVADETDHITSAFTGRITGADYSHINKQTGIVSVGDVLFDSEMPPSTPASAVIVAGISRVIGPSTDNLRMDVSVAIAAPDADTPPVIVDRVFRTSAGNGENLIKLRCRQTTSIREGHIVASRDGRRAVVGAIVRETDMPFSAQGIRPDIIINPMCLAENMSVAQLMEMLIGKSCMLRGSQGDGSAFANWGNKVSVFSHMLPDVKLHSSGNEIMYDGLSGEQLEAEIFMGVSYVSMLPPAAAGATVVRRHNRTADGNINISTNSTAVRMEDVDFAALSAHGSMNALTDAWLDRADKYYFAVCNQTGMVAIYNPAKHLFMSPMVDGPVQFTENLSNATTTMDIRQVTKHGRSFSIICAPYAFKMLLQELLTANVALRLITDDSLPQLELAIKHTDETSKRLKLGQTFYNKLVSGETDSAIVGVGTPGEEERTRRQREQDLLAEAAAEEAAEQRRMLSIAAHTAAQRLTSTQLMMTDVAPTPPTPGQFDDGSVFLQNSSPNPIQFPASRSPPSDATTFPNIEGDNIIIVDGDTVYDREDVQYPPSVWTATNVGAHFITIQTSDPRNGEDNMKVVLPSRLYRTKDVPVVYTTAATHDNIFGGGGTIGVNNNNNDNNNLPSSVLAAIPTLQFNPTINVVGHDNNAPIHNSDTANQQPHESVHVTKQHPTSVTTGNSLANTSTTYVGEPDHHDSNTKSGASNNSSNNSSSSSSSSSSGKSFVGGMIDFAKGFLIKKTG